MNAKFPINSTRPSQSGAALIVVLLMLIVVTLLGLAAMRGAIMQERMAASTIARSMAFQVAEAGLRQGELTIFNQSLTHDSFKGMTTCAGGLCPMPSSPTVTPAALDNPAFWASNVVTVGTAVQTSAGSIKPKFVIEDFGQTSASSNSPSQNNSLGPVSVGAQSVFRITSYASTPSGAEVIVQSLYRR